MKVAFIALCLALSLSGCALALVAGGLGGGVLGCKFVTPMQKVCAPK